MITLKDSMAWLVRAQYFVNKSLGTSKVLSQQKNNNKIIANSGTLQRSVDEGLSVLKGSNPMPAAVVFGRVS
jgi:hypothetical protein